MTRFFFPWLTVAAVTLLMSGCATTDNNTGQGALLGGLFGAGTGAVIGHAVGNTGAGAAIGAGVGALTGAAVGSNVDAQEDRARAAAAQAQAQAVAGAVSVPDVVAMTQAHVEEGLILDRIHSRGVAAPLQTNDVIYLHQQGVSPNVIAAMQATPVAAAVQPVYYGEPGPVIVEGGYYHRPHYYYPPPRVGIGFGWR